jgi:hypothetical protein
MDHQARSKEAGRVVQHPIQPQLPSRMRQFANAAVPTKRCPDISPISCTDWFSLEAASKSRIAAPVLRKNGEVNPCWNPTYSVVAPDPFLRGQIAAGQIAAGLLTVFDVSEQVFQHPDLRQDHQLTRQHEEKLFIPLLTENNCNDNAAKGCRRGHGQGRLLRRGAARSSLGPPGRERKGGRRRS